MQVPWFGWFAHKRDQEWAAKTPRQRSDEEITLALSTLPLYRVDLRLSQRDGAESAVFSHVLAPLVGEERAARILADAMRAGVAPIATCPRELAEHYRDELARHALPCVVEPA